MIDTSKARLYYRDGHVEYYEDQSIAYAIWLALPRGVRCAFRGRGDKREVYSWDYVDRM